MLKWSKGVTELDKTKQTDHAIHLKWRDISVYNPNIDFYMDFDIY